MLHCVKEYCPMYNSFILEPRHWLGTYISSMEFQLKGDGEGKKESHEM